MSTSLQEALLPLHFLHLDNTDETKHVDDSVDEAMAIAILNVRALQQIFQGIPTHGVHTARSQDTPLRCAGRKLKPNNSLPASNLHCNMKATKSLPHPK